MDAARAAVSELHASVSSMVHPACALDCEGINLSATGKLTLLQIAYEPSPGSQNSSPTCLLFDVLALGSLEVLRAFLEDPSIVKVRLSSAAKVQGLGLYALYTLTATAVDCRVPDHRCKYSLHGCHILRACVLDLGLYAVPMHTPGQHRASRQNTHTTDRGIPCALTLWTPCSKLLGRGYKLFRV